MMMTVPEYLVARRRAGMTDFARNADPDKSLQHAINGSARDLGHKLPNVAEDVIGGGVIDAGRQVFENHPPLDGERESAAPADPLCLFQ